MNAFYAILLGFVQGLTEFLPISSTAHLTISGKLLGLIDAEHPEAWTAFIAVMQLGTMAAVVGYFFKDVVLMSSSLLKDLWEKGIASGIREYSDSSRQAILIIIGTLPVALIGLFLHEVIEGNLTKTIGVIVASLVALAALLWLAEKVAKHVRTIEQLTIADALVIGFAQALALIPGSSRSGTTITAGLFVGLARQAAARFSFLLSIPAVLMSGVYEMLKIDASVFQLGVGNLVIATVVSAISGYAAIHWLLRYLQGRTTLVFVWYRLALGLVILVMLKAGIV